jgi:hypothetical protein
MKKLCVLAMVLAVAAMMASPAMATKSRVRALGAVDNYIEDDYNIFSWYGTLPSYANILSIELINDDYYHYWGWDYEPYLTNGPYNYGGEYGDRVNAAFSLIKGLGEDNTYGVLGLFFKEVCWGPNPIYAFPDMGSFFNELGPAWTDVDAFAGPLYNKFSIMYGYAVDGMSFGLFFSRSDQNMKLEASTGGVSGEGEQNWSYTTIGVGARFDIGESAYGDIAFDYNMASLNDDLTLVTEGVPWTLQDDAGSKIDVRGRVFYEYSEYLTIVPYIGFGWWDFAIGADDDSYYMGYACYGNKGMMIDFGIGTDWTVNEENTIIFAIEPYKYMKVEPSDCIDTDAPSMEAKMVTFPRFLLALESELTDWLTFRSGCYKDLTKWEAKLEADGDELTGTLTEAPFCYYIGLGFDVADFEFDCVVNEEVPFSAGYWLTGYQPSEYYDGNNRTPIWMISAKYHF